VDTAVHLGYDLAALKHSPVPAANSGVVVFAAAVPAAPAGLRGAGLGA